MMISSCIQWRALKCLGTLQDRRLLPNISPPCSHAAIYMICGSRPSAAHKHMPNHKLRSISPVKTSTHGRGWLQATSSAPVDADIGQQLVLGELALNVAVAVAPGVELLHYPGSQACTVSQTENVVLSCCCSTAWGMGCSCRGLSFEGSKQPTGVSCIWAWLIGSTHATWEPILI